MSKKFTVDIIGAGISGLATAYYLSLLENELLIRVWEKDATPGGLAGSFQTKHFSVEKFYHHIFKRDKALQTLINDIGLGADLTWRPASTGSYYFNQPFRLSSPIDLLRFKPLPFLDRVRFGLIMLHARRIKDWRKLDDISAKDYIMKISGKNVYQKIWEPLLKGKFGPFADDVSAAWLWCKLIDRGGSRDRRGVEYLGYLKGGLGRMFDRLIEEVTQRGHKVTCSTPVTKIDLNAEGRVVGIRVAGKFLPTDLVVGCAQLPGMLNILPDSLDSYKSSLARIKFLANVCLVLTLKNSLSDFYWTNVSDLSAPFVGIIEQTRWADSADFDNQHLVYISAYVPQDDRRISMSPEELLSYYLVHIQRMFPDFTTQMVLHAYKWTAPHTQPIVHAGYRHHIPAIQSPVDNLLLCTMAQIYPNDRQVSNGVEKALTTVNIIKDKLRQQ